MPRTLHNVQERWRVAAALLPEIDAATCTGCGECVVVCPTDALAWPELCLYDGACEPVCPMSAIQLPYVIVLG